MTSPLDDAALDELLKLREAGTSGTWEPTTGGYIEDERGHMFVSTYAPRQAEDARLIAASVNALPALVAEIRESRVKLRVDRECIVGQAEMMDALRSQYDESARRLGAVRRRLRDLRVEHMRCALDRQRARIAANAARMAVEAARELRAEVAELKAQLSAAENECAWLYSIVAGDQVPENRRVAAKRVIEAERARYENLRRKLAEESQRADEYRTELENAVARLASSDHVIREMQARERDIVQDKLEAERERDEARSALRMHYEECAQCHASLVRPDTPPHCEDCVVDDEHEIQWDEARAALSPKPEAE